MIKGLFKWAARLAVLLTVFLAVTVLMRDRIGHFLLRNILAYYADRADIVLKVGSMSGRLFSGTDLNDISLRPSDDLPQNYHLKADTLSCTYNLWDLPKGAELFLGGLSCAAYNPEFSLNLGMTAEKSANGPAIIFPDGNIPRINLINGALFLEHPEWRTIVEHLDARLQPAADTGVELQLGAENLRFIDEGLTRIETKFQTHLQIRDEKITVESFIMGDENVSGSGSIDFSRFTEGAVGFASELVFTESRLDISGTMEEKQLTANLKTENFDLEELQKRLGGAGWDLSGKIRGRAEIVYGRAPESESRGSFEADMHAGKFHGIPFDAITLKGILDRQDIKVSVIEILSPGNHAAANDLILPLDKFAGGDFLAVARQARGQFTVSITDAGPLLQVLQTEEYFPGFLKPYALNVGGNLENGVIHISEALLTAKESQFAVREATVSLPEEDALTLVEFMRKTRAQLYASTKEMPAILKIFKIDDVLPDTARPDSATFQGYLENSTLHVREALLTKGKNRLTVQDAALRIPEGKEAFGLMPITAHARFETADIGGFAGLLGNSRLQGSLTADARLSGTLIEPTVNFTAGAQELVVADRFFGTLTIQGDVQVQQKDLGELEALRLHCAEFVQTNASGTLSLAAPAEMLLRDGKLSVRAALDVDRLGSLVVELDKILGHAMSARITTRNLSSDGWLADYIDDRLFFQGADIEASLQGWPEKPALEMTGRVLRAGGKEIPFPFGGSFSFLYSRAGVTVREFSWNSPGRNQLSLTGYLPYDPLNPEPFLAGELSLKAHLDFPRLTDIAFLLEPYGITGETINLDANISGTWKSPVGRVTLRATGLTPPDAIKEYLGAAAADLSCSLKAADDYIILESATLDSSTYTVRGSGNWKHDLSAKKLLQQHIPDLQGEITADASAEVKDFHALADRIDWLRRLEGNLQGRLSLSGPIRKPIASGTFTFQDGEAVHTLNFPKLSAINLAGSFEKDSITITKLQAELGGSPISADGRLYRENGAVKVLIKAAGKNILLFRDNDMWVRGDASLQASGPVSAMTISGETGITGGYYTKSIDFLGLIGSSSAPVSEGVNFLFSIPEPPFRDAVFNIRITAVEPFRIRNNLIRSSLRPDLTLKGTGELPLLNGTIYIDPSRILLPSGRLQVQSGLLRFLEKEPDRPQLDLLASSKIQGYDINVISRGPLDDPVISLSSSPPLPNEDLLLLLLTGQLPQKDAFSGTKSAGTRNVLVFISRDFLTKWLEDDIGVSDETLLDRFELDYGRGLTRSGEQTVESAFRLTDRSEGTGRIYYLSGEKDRYDAYNYGLKLVFRFD